MSDDPSVAIGGVLETCLYAEELDDTASFYERVLGLEAFARVADRHVFFRCGSGVFLLFNPERTAHPSGPVAAHGAVGPGHVAFAIAADDLDSWRSRLEQHGIALETELTWPTGGVSLYLRDPHGNSVELATPATWGLDEADFFDRT